MTNLLDEIIGAIREAGKKLSAIGSVPTAENAIKMLAFGSAFLFSAQTNLFASGSSLISMLG